MQSNNERSGLEEGIQTLMCPGHVEKLHRMANVGAVASSVAHEFNNILTTILNHAKMGIRSAEADSKQQALERILAATQRAARITTGMLALSRNRLPRREAVAPVTLVESVLAIVQKDLGTHQIRLERDFHDAPSVDVVPAQIEQVLMNVIINARQAMGTRGVVRIGVDWNAAARLVEISVSDTGPGIPPDRLPRIFEPFYTTKQGPDDSGQGGSGLGLAICREIIERHQGRIRVESQPGRGTKVTIKLPAAAADTRAA